MGFINSVTETFRDSLKPKLDWRVNARGLSGLFSRKRNNAALAIDVDDQDFLQRYKNVRLSSSSSLFFMSVSFLSVPFAESKLSLFTLLIAVTLFFLFYFRYAYLMWICRERWGRAEDLEQAVLTTPLSYIRHLLDNPSEILPLKLPAKGELK